MENQAIYETIANKLKFKADTENYNKYDHIELTEEETLKALYEAKKIKAGKLAEAEYWRKVRTPVEKMNFEQAYQFYLNKAKSIIPNFTLDENIEPIFAMLCEYFISEESGKGLMLCGPVGCGKTTLMKIFSENQKQSYAVVSARTPSYEFAKEGFDGIEKYYTEFHLGQNRFRQSEYGCCFDDLGTEDEKKNFGNSVNVMLEILLNRYDKTKIGSTHITTNLTADQIKETYGERAASRMRQMFKMITFDINSKDLRK